MKTTHELARKLLEGPDIQAVLEGCGMSPVLELKYDSFPDFIEAPRKEYCLIHLKGHGPDDLNLVEPVDDSREG